MAKKRGGAKKRSASSSSAAAAEAAVTAKDAAATQAADEFFVPKGSRTSRVTDDADSDVSGAEEEDMQLRVNEKFASKFQAQKRKEELSRLEKQRRLYGSDGSESESDSETEDEDGEQLTRALDADIRKTLQLIRKKDPAIYDSSIAFFQQEDKSDDDDDGDDDEDSDEDAAAKKQQQKKKKQEKKKKDAPLYYKDLVRQQVIAGDVDSDDEKDSEPRVMTYGEEQAKLKQDFLATLKDAAGSDDDEANVSGDDNAGDDGELDGGLFTIRKKSEGERQTEDEEYAAFTSKYGTALKKKEVDPEAFLEHYLSSEGWKDKRAAIPHYDEIVNDDDDDSADELEKAEEFEHKYNFRFEEEGSGVIQTHARRIDDSMRREDDSRKRKRAERKERKALERLKKEEELRRLKNLKQAEIQSKLEKVARLMGKNTPEAAALKLKPSDLEGEFDPDEYDRRMQEVFDEEYYNEDDENMEKPVWDDEEDKALFAGLPSDPDDEEEDDAEDADEEEGDEVTTSNIIEREAQDNDDEDDEEGEDNDDEDDFLSEEKAKSMTPEELARAKQKYLDELYSLDYEDLIGDLKCRFKYHRVRKNDFGLTADEIMEADDKELKALVSLKKMAPYLEEEYQVDRKRVKKFKKSLEQVRREREEKRAKKAEAAAAAAESEAAAAAGAASGGKKRKRTKKSKGVVNAEADGAEVAHDDENEGSEGKSKKAKKSSTEAEKEANSDAVETPTEAGDSKQKKKQRRSKKKSQAADAAAKKKSVALKATGLSSSRLESYKLAKPSKK